jgi:hypothetical protein
MRTWPLSHPRCPHFLKAWPRLVVMVVLLALLPCPAASIRAAPQSEESLVHQPNQPDECKPCDDAADYLDAPIPRPASPFSSVSSTNRLPLLMNLILILRRFPHRILAMLSMLDCWRRSLPQLVRTGGRWHRDCRICMSGVRRLSSGECTLFHYQSDALKGHSRQLLYTSVSKRSPRRDRFTRCDHVSTRTRC